MTELEQNFLDILVEIRDRLDILEEIESRVDIIAVCHEEKYEAIRQRRLGEELEAFKKMMANPTRRQMFPLLFKNLSQAEIAQIVGKTQPTVSRFITKLRDAGLIDQITEPDGSFRYEDKYNLIAELEKESDK